MNAAATFPDNEFMAVGGAAYPIREALYHSSSPECHVFSMMLGSRQDADLPGQFVRPMLPTVQQSQRRLWQQFADSATYLKGRSSSGYQASSCLFTVNVQATYMNAEAASSAASLSLLNMTGFL